MATAAAPDSSSIHRPLKGTQTTAFSESSEHVQGELRRFERAVGKRLQNATLDNFVLHGSPSDKARQRKVLDALRDFEANLSEHILRGTNLILHGPCGSGKDHCLASLGREAIKTKCDFGLGEDRIVRYVDGQEKVFFRYRFYWTTGNMLKVAARDRITAHESERRFLDQYASTTCLVIEDPATTDQSNYQMDTLLTIIDARYRDRRSTWISINVADGAGASRLLGARVVDRLRAGAVCLHLDWPTYRRPIEC